MCQQDKILKDIRGKIPKTCAAIHTAISQDYVTMEMRMSNIEKNVAGIEKNMATKKDLEQLKHTLLPLTNKASKWDLMQTLLKSKLFWVFAVIFMSALSLAGQRLFEILKPAAGI